MRKNKAVVLGAGRGQIPIMDLCHKYGFDVIAVTPKGDWPAVNVADKVYYADVKDTAKVIEIIRAESANAVLSDQLDAAVCSCAIAAERTGLRGISKEAALKFKDKYEMRKAAEEAGVSVPHYVCVESCDDAVDIIKSSDRLNFPVMIKPADSSSSHGVYMIHDEDELRLKFPETKSWSLSGRVMIEQVIKGREYVVDAWTQNYRTTNLIIGSRNYFDIPDTFIPCSTLFVDSVSSVSHEEEKVKAANKKLVESFGLEYGITHGEYFYVPETDDVYLVEIAARGGGVFTSSDIIPAASGVNANELLVREAIGIGNDSEINITSGAAAYFCYLTPEGIVRELRDIDKVESIHGVLKAFFDNIELGMHTKPITDKASRKGPVLVHGRTKQECLDVISRVRETISIKVETENGLSDVIWE